MTSADARRLGLDARRIAWLEMHDRLNGVELANDTVRRRLFDAHLAYLSERSTPMHAQTLRKLTPIIAAVALAAPPVGGAATHRKPVTRHVKRTIPSTSACTTRPLPGIASPC